MRPIVKEYITIIIIGALCLFLIISFINSNNLEYFDSNITTAATYPSGNIVNNYSSVANGTPNGTITGTITQNGTQCGSCDVVNNPNYLNNQQTDSTGVYAQSVINRQAKQIKNLRSKIMSMANEIDNHGFYRKKLNNQNYKPKPFLSSTGQSDMLNLYDDDFSNKTLSTIKFLSQTRESKYFGDEIHFPTELCGNFCSTSDPNRGTNAQVDSIRPFVAPTSPKINTK